MSFIHEINSYRPIGNILSLILTSTGFVLNLILLVIQIKTRTFNNYQDIFGLLKVIGDLQMSFNFGLSCLSFYFINTYDLLGNNEWLVQMFGWGLMFGIQFTMMISFSGPFEPYYLLVVQGNYLNSTSIGRLKLSAIVSYPIFFASLLFMMGERFRVTSVIHAVCFDISPTASRISRNYTIISATVVPIFLFLVSIFMSYRIHFALEARDRNNPNAQSVYLIQRNLQHQSLAVIGLAGVGLFFPVLFLLWTGFGNSDTRYFPLLPTLFCVLITFHTFYNPLIVFIFDRKVKAYLAEHNIGFMPTTINWRRNQSVMSGQVRSIYSTLTGKSARSHGIASHNAQTRMMTTMLPSNSIIMGQEQFNFRTENKAQSIYQSPSNGKRKIIQSLSNTAMAFQLKAQNPKVICSMKVQPRTAASSSILMVIDFSNQALQGRQPRKSADEDSGSKDQTVKFKVGANKVSDGSQVSKSSNDGAGPKEGSKRSFANLSTVGEKGKIYGNPVKAAGSKSTSEVSNDNLNSRISPETRPIPKSESLVISSK